MSTAGVRHLAESAIWLAAQQSHRLVLHPSEWRLPERIAWSEAQWAGFLAFAASLPTQLISNSN